MASYIFISILCILVRNLYFHEGITAVKAVFMIFDFTADSYSWYVEMYIGLFLLTPFLNFMYQGAATAKGKAILILSLLAVTALPYFFYSFNSPDGNPLQFFLPKYWMAIYPVTYYFIGSFLREYQPKINKALLSVFIIVYILMLSAALFCFNYGKNFSWRFLGEYGGLTTVILTTAFFLLFYDVDIKNRLLKGAVTQISLVSFDMYLLSRITDLLLYDYYYKHFEADIGDFAILASVSFVCAFVLAELKRLLFFLVLLPIRKKSAS